MLRETPPKLAEARRLYADIPTDTPFAAFRRSHGLAYCAWKQGDETLARAEARAAAEHAADGGLIRFRAQSLTLLGHIVGGEEGEALHERARGMARTLEHEDLF